MVSFTTIPYVQIEGRVARQNLRLAGTVAGAGAASGAALLALRRLVRS